MIFQGCDQAAPATEASAAVAASTDTSGVYPRDITPPPGTNYPCALTALPVDLPGIPAADRQYINRTYARILRATQAKLVALKALESDQSATPALEKYESTTRALIEALKQDSPPSGLQQFHSDVIKAIDLQRSFFLKARPIRERGGTMADVFALSEAREASGRLIAAWGKMEARYPAWSADTRDSIFHHLCALDFF